MGIPLEEALQQVELEVGRTYRCQVNCLWVELRVLGLSAQEGAHSIPESDIMLDAWIEFPEPKTVGIVRAKLGEPDLPDYPEIPQDDDAP